MAEEQEDFSFPTTTDTPPRFVDSPPLWRPDKFSFCSPPKKLTPERINQDYEDEYYCKFYASRKGTDSMPQRKSFSYVERGTLKTRRVGVSDDYDDEDDEEEKMDMLWEDFNEEFSARNSKVTTMADSDHMSPAGRMLNFGCVQALKLSKANKKPSIVVFMKVFMKKMFLNQNSHRLVKKNHQ